MKISSLAGVAVVALAINGCAAATDTSSENQSVGSTTQAVVGTPGGGGSVPGVPGTPLFAEYDWSDHTLDVQTCPAAHDPNLDSGNIMDHPCTIALPDRHLKLVNALVLNDFGRIVGDAVVVEDGPGGGCIHVQITDAVAGGSLRVLAIGKNLDGSGAHHEDVYFFKVST